MNNITTIMRKVEICQKLCKSSFFSCYEIDVYFEISFLELPELNFHSDPELIKIVYS
jgi:hypothetical protein